MTKTVRKQPDRDSRSAVLRRLSTSWFRWVFWQWNKTNNEKFCMTKTILWHRSNPFLGWRRFVRAADPVYRECWQSDAPLDLLLHFLVCRSGGRNAPNVFNWRQIWRIWRPIFQWNVMSNVVFQPRDCGFWRLCMSPFRPNLLWAFCTRQLIVEFSAVLSISN